MKKAWLVVLLLLLAFSAVGLYVQRNSFLPSKNSAANPVADNKTLVDPVSTCTEYTREVEEGPYYVANTAKLQNNELNYTKLPGTPIKLVGYVYEGENDKSKPIANAKVDIWQADNNGEYHPEANGDIANYPSDQIALRGYVLTDAKGKYFFTSIYPGYYEGRARHIHIKISADGFAPITTQVIYQPKPGDGVIYSEDEDAKLLPECHLIEMRSINGYDEGAIDFRLKRAE